MKVFNAQLARPVTIRNKSATKTPWSAWRVLFSVPFLTGLLLVAIVLSISFGAYPVRVADWLSLFQVDDSADVDRIRYLLLHIRLPRVALALIVGAGLALAGGALQGLFRNPLADPGLVGVSGGAMLFAVAGLALVHPVVAFVTQAMGYAAVAVMAFVGSLCATWLVYRIATAGQQTQIASILLAGIAISALAGALTGLFTYFSDEQRLRDITFWTLGSLSGANWQIAGVTAFPVSLSAFFILKNTAGLNLFLLGESEAAFAGVPVQKLKKQIIIAIALAVGACVAVCGMIGFIGLVMPHLARMGAGADHHKLLIRAALLGAILLLLADTAARTIIAPAELPIGVLTALLGAPFFLWILMQKKQVV